MRWCCCDPFVYGQPIVSEVLSCLETHFGRGRTALRDPSKMARRMHAGKDCPEEKMLLDWLLVSDPLLEKMPCLRVLSYRPPKLLARRCLWEYKRDCEAKCAGCRILATLGSPSVPTTISGRLQAWRSSC